MADEGADGCDNATGDPAALPKGDPAGALVKSLTGPSTPGVTEGAEAGEAEGAGDDAARTTLTANFMPFAQCPGVPQMKYLLPGLDRGTTVVPLLSLRMALLVLQAS